MIKEIITSQQTTLHVHGHVTCAHIGNQKLAVLFREVV